MVLPVAQTYTDGTVVKCQKAVEGQAEPEHPAPSFVTTAKDADPPGRRRRQPRRRPDPADEHFRAHSGDAGSAAGWIGLVAGLLGLAAGVTALVRTRPPGPSNRTPCPAEQPRG